MNDFIAFTTQQLCMSPSVLDLFVLSTLKVTCRKIKCDDLSDVPALSSGRG